MPEALYEKIGRSYVQTRRPDPRIAAAINDALGPARSVLNIGAGTGSYEPTGRTVLAVEPSQAMIDQRPQGSAPVIRGVAERLPAGNKSFDAALAVLTVHHWADRDTAYAEIHRVVRERAVFLTCDPDAHFWLHDYFPAIADLDHARLPPLSEFETLGSVSTSVVAIPHDCTDGFLAAHWRHPNAYLDPTTQANISALALLPKHLLREGTSRLASDLATGNWTHSYGHLIDQGELDVGYRLITATFDH